MAKTKKILKAKEPIRLRAKKLSNGNQSLYLDHYQDGKREYEFLKLYLILETTPEAKRMNLETLKAANTIKAQRIIDLTNGYAGIKPKKLQKLNVLTYIENYASTKNAERTKIAYITLKKHLQLYRGDNILFSDVDKNFVEGFIMYLSQTANTHIKHQAARQLSKTTQHLYYTFFVGVLNAAVKDEIIPSNPSTLISNDKKTRKQVDERVFLTIDELKKLISAPCRNEIVRQAFLFSCFCGLRYSDIRKLNWCDIYTNNGKTAIHFRQQKTGVQMYTPLSPEAIKYLPQKINGVNTVFHGLLTISNVNIILKQWSNAAGINKHVTFHTSRHTQATMLLSLGADLYTVSKLLGHTNIRTTEIYAKIIDKKKDEAVNLTNGIF